MIRRELKRIADSQHGYFTAQQAISAGYAHRHHVYHVKHGNWLHIERGLFRLRGYPDCQESEFIHWSLWAIGRSQKRTVAVSHQSALYYHGLADSSPQSVHLTVPGGTACKKENPHCVFHHQELMWSDLIVKNSFAITTPLRTLRDMNADLLLFGRWREAVWQALSMQLISEANACGLIGEEIISALYGDYSSRRPIAPIADRSKGMAMENQHTAQKAEGDDSCGEPLKKPVRFQIHREMIRTGRSFTLVEMLVVIAIIMILASLLMPSLMKAARSAKAAVCINNAKQIGSGMSGYLNDYDQMFPPERWGSGVWTEWKKEWVVLLAPYLNENLGDGQNGYAEIPLGSIFRCPVMEYTGKSSVFACGYGYNTSALGRSNLSPLPAGWGQPEKNFPTRISRIAKPSQQCVTTDAWWNPSVESDRYRGNLSIYYLDRICFRHSRKSATLYADGHAALEDEKWLRQSHPTTYPMNWYLTNKSWYQFSSTDYEATIGYYPYDD